MPTRLRAVLFDLDGTLIDSIPLILDSMHYAFAGIDRPRPDDAELITGIGTPLWLQLGKYARDDAELTLLRTRYREFQGLHHDEYVRAFPGVAETLAALQAAGMAMAIVTSKGDEFARKGLDHAGLGAFIEVIVGADSTKKHKPDPEPVLLALERLGVAAGDAVMVGDSPHDIAAGNAAGVATVAALWGPFSREQLEVAKPTYFASTIGGLGALLKA
jgi:pyrophosphatase PpaX